MNVVGYTMSKNCADQVFAQAGFKEGEGRDQVGVVELHDCFAANEVFFNFFGRFRDNSSLFVAPYLRCPWSLRAWAGA